ncbi:MAG: hypothetical protein EXS16_05880 [Gemmataceae bacterium]|nr:hypothetical protein [Gemmataceae bacterium]
MGFHITHRFGVMTSNPPLSAFRALLEELNELPGDEEHCSVSVTHESKWCLGAYGGGYLIWENLEGDAPRHITGVSEENILFLWEALAKGDIEFIEREPWLPGY